MRSRRCDSVFESSTVVTGKEPGRGSEAPQPGGSQASSSLAGVPAATRPHYAELRHAGQSNLLTPTYSP
jgi:hypothetical protein